LWLEKEQSTQPEVMCKRVLLGAVTLGVTGSETTERSKVVERVATALGGYLTAYAAGDNWEVDVGGRKCELLRGWERNH